MRAEWDLGIILGRREGERSLCFQAPLAGVSGLCSTPAVWARSSACGSGVPEQYQNLQLGGVEAASCLKGADSGSKGRKLKKSCWVWANYQRPEQERTVICHNIVAVCSHFRISPNILIHFNIGFNYLQKFSWRPRSLKTARRRWQLCPSWQGCHICSSWRARTQSGLAPCKGQTKSPAALGKLLSVEVLPCELLRFPLCSVLKDSPFPVCHQGDQLPSGPKCL